MNLRRVAETIAVPKLGPADSFLLHAPLELLARVALRPLVRTDDLDRADQRLAWLGAAYESVGEPVSARPRLAFDSPAAAATRVVQAVRAGEADDADDAALALIDMATAPQLRDLLATDLVTSLAAAAHASILLFLLPRIDDKVPMPGGLVRGMVRELTQHADWRLRWFDDPDEPAIGDTLEHALLDVPMLGPPGSNFIYPIMNQAEESGVVAKLLSGVVAGAARDLGGVARDLTRIAALSMLQEGPQHSAYGWSHCLTLPQAVMGISGSVRDPRVAVAVAATYVVGFRAALGDAPLDPEFRPTAPVPGMSLGEALDAGPDVAAGFAWHAPPAERASLVAELATRAVRHHDAHFAKYTLACFDAAGADPERAGLYLAAAAYLAGYWSQRGDDALFS